MTDSNNSQVGLLPRMDTASKSVHVIDDDLSQYEVQSRTERLYILKGLQETGSQIIFYFNHGYDFLLISLVEISTDGKSLIFEYGSNKEMNSKALQTNQIRETLNKV